VLTGELREIKRSYARDRLVIRSAQRDEILRAFSGRCTALSEDEVMLRLASPDEKKTVMKLITESYDIDEIRVFEPTLGDIFVEYAGEQV